MGLTGHHLGLIVSKRESQDSWGSNCKMITDDSLDQGLLINLKLSLLVWMWDICDRVTLNTSIKKDVFAHNFWIKALRMKILASKSMFTRSRNLMVQFVLTYNLDLSRSWPLRNHILALISVTNAQNIAKF